MAGRGQPITDPRLRGIRQASINRSNGGNNTTNNNTITTITTNNNININTN
jgi:hypothetical protein